MNKKLRWLLQPRFSAFFVVLMAFALGALSMRQYLLAGIEFAVTGLLLGFVLLFKNRRRRELQNYLNRTLDETNGKNAQPPFPMVAFRMSDGGVFFANDGFTQISGMKEGLDEWKITDILPGFSTQWLTSGKSEHPYDVKLQGHRYRVYGTTIVADDVVGSRLGVIYFADLTELYQVRDEYIRSRPVVSIILVDNYEELTKNLTEGAISALNAKINDALTEWTESYHGLLRRLEKNRFLFIFEKRDLKRAIDDKFSILEDIHEITNPSGLAASISFGLGVDAETFEEGYDFAALSIEMALSRGGDQAVIKDRLN